jgi:hypothetical protein
MKLLHYSKPNCNGKVFFGEKRCFFRPAADFVSCNRSWGGNQAAQWGVFGQKTGAFLAQSGPNLAKIS